MESQSLVLATSYLNQIIQVYIDRQLGSVHPKWKFKYPVNYGYIKDVLAPDGEELDAYVLKIDKPLDKFTGRVVAIIHRINDDDDKLIVIPDGQSIADDEIEKLTEFQEKWFKHEIVR
ncbi:MAG: inorganic diphosphatase [Candidatus Shapirobacteria bacterium]|nr:inorganic diphosphatase [Candidatus Shapirobacteria bacterium]